jgi:hypothetical protein
MKFVGKHYLTKPGARIDLRLSHLSIHNENKFPVWRLGRGKFRPRDIFRCDDPEYMGWQESADLINQAVEKTLRPIA